MAYLVIFIQDNMEENTVSEKRTIVFNIYEFIHNFYNALISEDFMECSRLQNYLFNTYNQFSKPTQKQFQSLIIPALSEFELDNDKDLNGVFNEILSQKIKLN